MFADVINKAIPFFLLPIITNHIKPTEYGYVANIVSFMSILFVFARMGTDGFTSVKYLKKEFTNIYHLMINAFLNSLSITLLLALILTTLVQFIDFSQFFPIEWIYIILIACFFNVFTQARLALFQAQENPSSFGKTQFFVTVVNFLLSYFLVVEFELGWTGRAIGVTTAWVIPGIFSVIIILKNGVPDLKIEKAIVKEARVFGLPLIVHHLNDWLKKGADVFMLSALIGTASAGIYSVSFQLSMIINFIAYAIIRGITPMIYRKLNEIENQKEHVLHFLRKVTIYYIAVILLLTILLVVGLPIFIEYFFNSAYLDVIELIPLLLLGYFFNAVYLILSPYFFYYKRTLLLSRVTLFTGTFHVVLSYFLIQNNQVLGSVYANIISQLVTLIIAFYYSTKLLPQKWYLAKKQ